MNILKFFLIAFLIVFGVLALSVCADSIGIACVHACCTGLERSRPLARLARKLKCVYRSAFDRMLLLMGGSSRGLTLVSDSLVSTPALLKVSALRI